MYLLSCVMHLVEYILPIFVFLATHSFAFTICRWPSVKVKFQCLECSELSLIKILEGFCSSPLPTFVFPAHQFCISHREMTGAGRIPRCPKVKERDRGMPGTLSLSPTMHYYASSSSSSSSSPPPSPRPSPPIPLKISPRHHQHALSLHKKYQFCKTIPHT